MSFDQSTQPSPPKPAKTRDTTSINAQIPHALADRLKAQVDKEERTQSIVVRRAIERYLDAEGV